MSNETKRDVVLQIAKENRDLRMYDPESIEPEELIEQDYQDWIREYDAALPDDLPVIPKAVSEWIKDAKASYYDLLDAMTKWTLDQPVFDWIHDNSETFASAWLEGVWRIQGTGEIVKLEADK